MIATPIKMIKASARTPYSLVIDPPAQDASLATFRSANTR